MKIGKLLLKWIGVKMAQSEKKALSGVIFDMSDDTLFDIPYSEEIDERLKFDLLLSRGSKRKNTLIIDIHGGAYYHGHRKNNYKFANYFREAGYDVAVADYRLTNSKPGFSVEDEVKDLLSLLVYLSSHLADYGLGDDEIVLMGDSAGGHFALLLSEILSDKNLQNKWGVDVSLPEVRAVVLNCPVYDFHVSVYGSYLSKGGRDYMYGPGWQDKEWTKKLDPKLYLSSLRSPVFVSSCRNDFLKEHAIALSADLEGLSLEHEFFFLKSKNRKAAHVHNVIDLLIPESVEVNKAILDFLAKKV